MVRACSSVQYSSVQYNSVQYLQQVVDLDLGVAGAGHAVVAARVEGEAGDCALVSSVELLQLPGPEVIVESTKL